jgi:hypothetical protein
MMVLLRKDVTEAQLQAVVEVDRVARLEGTAPAWG